MALSDIPRSYVLSSRTERERLMRETLLYAYVSLNQRDGTDLEGRRFAYDALRRAIAGGYELVPPEPK